MNNESQQKQIYLSPPHLSGQEKEMLLEALESNWITTLGPQVDAFEKEMEKKIGVGQAVALASGTAALHLALVNLGVGLGDVVFCSDLTFAASANAIVYCGAKPVFIDSDRLSWNMDPGLFREELDRAAGRGKLPRAVIVVDLYGQCADYDAILKAAGWYGVPVVADAAEALGAYYKGAPAGSFGTMAVLSFNGNKIITTSGGGMLLSNNRGYIERTRFLATQARDPAPHYEHSVIGYNYRMSNLLAAVGRAQLKVLDDRVEVKRRIFNFYQGGLRDLPGIEFMPEPGWSRSSRWLTVILITPEEFGADREAVRLALEAENIESRPVWKPMHMQPVFKIKAQSAKRKAQSKNQASYQARMVGGAVSEDLFARGLCLPSGTQLTEKDLDRIIRIIRKQHR